MAGLSATSELRNQLGAVAQLRMRLFINSLRGMRGRLELGSKIFTGVMFSIAGVGIGFGAGFAAWTMVSEHSVPWIAALLWAVFLLRQLLPLLVNPFTDNLDLSSLLRLPLSYRAFFLVRLTFGLFDAGSILSTMATLGILIGVTAADWRLFPWVLPILILFTILNALIERTISTWIDRWLAQRRTREIFAAISFLLLFGLQLIGPLSSRHHGRFSARTEHIAEQVAAYQKVLPPGAAGEGIASAAQGDAGLAVTCFCALGLYTLGVGWLLHLRLRAEYRGENLSETAAVVSHPKATGRPTPQTWHVPGSGGPVAALVEKEVRYLMRSGPLLFTLITPIFFLIIFGAGRMRGGFQYLGSQFGFPIAVAYALMILTNLVYNSFGSDEAGVQIYFVLPIRIRTVTLAKNLVHTSILLLQTMVIWLVIGYLFTEPSLQITIATLAWGVFAVAVNLIVGNLLSLSMPKKAELGKFGRQKPATASAFIALGAQAVTIGSAALVVWLSRLAGSLWIAAAVFCFLGAVGVAAYSLLLQRIDGFAMKQRESLIEALSRT